MTQRWELWLTRARARVVPARFRRQLRRYWASPRPILDRSGEVRLRQGTWRSVADARALLNATDPDLSAFDRAAESSDVFGWADTRSHR